MRIPKPLYEAVPTIYAIAGILVIFATLYNGLYDSLAYGWVCVGMFLIGNGVHLNLLRARHRGLSQRRVEVSLADTDMLAQTVISSR
ncbi:MAG: hypothetical protein AAF578_07395 [Pseudomonadota bacterium]